MKYEIKYPLKIVTPAKNECASIPSGFRVNVTNAKDFTDENKKKQ